MMMPTAPTPKDHSTARVSKGIQEMELRASTLKSAKRVQITAMLMPTVTTPKDRSTVRVIRDTLEMESRVLI